MPLSDTNPKPNTTMTTPTFAQLVSGIQSTEFEGSYVSNIDGTIYGWSAKERTTEGSRHCAPEVAEFATIYEIDGDAPENDLGQINHITVES